jgi:hypothetical protein
MRPLPNFLPTRSSLRHRVAVAALAIALAAPATARTAGQQAPRPSGDRLNQPLDQVLDLYVRDGLVYYRALQIEHRKLDDYIRALDSQDVAGWPRDQQVAFWLNAYNAFVLQTVINNYPIRGRSNLYPSNSIRQVSGAFERLPHRAGGRTVTLDQIEKEVLPTFRDPRLYLALGRGAVGSGRLRSEAYRAAELETMLQDATQETATELSSFEIDRGAKEVHVSSVFGWHEAEFAAAYGAAGSRYAGRSPVERGILALVEPFLFGSEIEFLEQNQFKLSYRNFDWSLNDLTGR